ncbi:MAG TPA: HEAT repeat domain-containing protein [Candidatus Ozemobacteraceae bacterium]|nr:HEAT repeat domain-containing protein [Candidatus Ozemobacteraceae bacterium]
MERPRQRVEGPVTPAEPAPQAATPNRARLFWLLAAFFLIQKGTNNVLYLTWLAGLLKNLGSTMLPWAYLAGNVSFIALQYGFVRRLKGREGHWMLSFLSLPVVLFSVATSLTTGFATGGALLAGLVGAMLVDLLTNQSFSAMANQMLSLQEAKRRLPAIYGAGSAGYILSGILMKTILDFVGSGPLLWLNTAVLCLGAVLLQQIGLFDTPKEGVAGPTTKTPGAAQAVPEPPASSFRQPLAVLLLASSVLIVFNRFLIDYLFSVSVTTHFADAAAIASFLGLFGAAADFTVIALQITVMNRVFASLPLGRILLLTPFLLTFLCLAATVHPAFIVVAVTQFVVLLNSKNFTVPATTLLLGAFPSSTRGGYRRDISTVSSAASITASLVLLAARDRVPVGGLFLIAAACYGLMVYVHSRIDEGYAATLRETLAGTGTAPDDENLRSIGFLPENERLQRLQELLAQGDPVIRLEAIGEIELLPDRPLRLLLFPRLSLETDSRCLTALARLAVERFGADAVSHIARLLQSAGDTRLQADLLEALGRTNGGLPVEELAAMYLEHDHHRVRGSAVLAMLRLARDAGGIEAGLSTLSGMARSPHPLFRASAAAIMGETALPLFLESMEALTNDPDTDVACIAIRALGRLPTSGGLAALNRLAAHSDPIRARHAANLVEKASKERLARIRSLMDGLTAAERQKLGHTIRSIGGSAGLDIVGRILSFDHPEAREGLVRLLEQATPETVELLRACLVTHAAPSGSPSTAPLWEACRVPRLSELPDWASAIPLLRQVIGSSPTPPGQTPDDEGMLGLLRLIIREAEFLACLRQSGGRAGWSADELATGLSRWSDRAVLCCRMVLLAGPRPETLLSAFDRLRSPDAFTSSVAQELLETNLPHEVSRMVLHIRNALSGLSLPAESSPEAVLPASPLVPAEEAALLAYLRPQENLAS